MTRAYVCMKISEYPPPPPPPRGGRTYAHQSYKSIAASEEAQQASSL